MSNKIFYYCASTFSYGFYRGLTFTHRNMNASDKDSSDILFSDRLYSGFISGISYMNPLLQPIFIFRLMDRIEIQLTNKDPLKYSLSYCDGVSYNSRTI